MAAVESAVHSSPTARQGVMAAPGKARPGGVF